MTTFDTDPNTQTVAAGWSSSPLGNPDHDFFLADLDPADPATATAPAPVAEGDRRRPPARHAIVAAALACGIGGGAALALSFADFRPDEPTVATPSISSPQPAVVITPHSTVLPPAPVATAPPAVAPAPSTAEVATPPAAAPAESTVVEVPTPQAPAPETPAEDDAPPPEPENPEPENPQPPVFDPDLPFKLPVPPKPEPPVFDPDLPLAPAPAPKPDPVPLPDLDLKAGPNS